jgi:hypothetical protein
MEEKPSVSPFPYISSVARVGGLDKAGDLGRRRGRGRAAARHLDLGAGDVELRRAARVVDGEGLDAEEVLARRDARGDRARIRARHGPACLAVGELGTP